MLEQQKHYNDNQFERHLEASKDPVWFCARYLSELGYSISIEPTVKGSHEEWREHRDNGHIYIWMPGWNKGEPQRVEVKQLSAMSAPEDFKFSSMMVCAVHSWKEANPKPLVYILINKQRTHLAMIYSKDQPSWFTRTVQDKRYAGEYTQEMYFCPLQYVHWRTI